MLRNWHFVVALLVAPMLAIMAWFAVDYFVAERPHAAIDGGAYSLLAKPNCRYNSGQCDLENGDFELALKALASTEREIQIELVSALPLGSATLGLANDGTASSPIPMRPTSADFRHWVATIDLPTPNSPTLRIAATAQGTTWYAEVPTVFFEPASSSTAQY